MIIRCAQLFLWISFFLPSLAHGATLVEWLLHSDGHIVNDHREMTRYLRNNSEFGVTGDTVTIPTQPTDWRQSFRLGIQEGLTSLNSQNPELLVLLASHGHQGSVSLHGEKVALNEISDILAEEIGRHEARHGAVKISIIYSACFSGTIGKPLEEALRQRGIESEVTALMSAPRNRVSHSTILLDYMEKASQRLAEVDRSHLIFGKGLSFFDRLTKLIAGNEFNPKDQPTAWSTNSRVTNWTFEDVLAASWGQEKSVPRILKNHAEMEGMWANLPAQSLLKYLFQKEPAIVARNFVSITILNQYLEGKGQAIEAEKVLQSVELTPRLRGYVTGWVSALGPEYDGIHQQWLKMAPKFSLKRDGMTSVDVEFWWTYMESRIDLFLNRGQLDLALAEFDRMSNVPVGWQHSSSPASYFRSKAADVLLAFLSNNYFGEKSKMDAVIEKLMAMKNGQVRLVKGIVSDQSFDIGRFPKLLDLAVSKGLTDVILNAQYGYSEALLESIKRVADRNGFQDPGEFEYWKKDMKRPGGLPLILCGDEPTNYLDWA